MRFPTSITVAVVALSTITLCIFGVDARCIPADSSKLHSPRPARHTVVLRLFSDYHRNNNIQTPNVDAVLHSIEDEDVFPSDVDVVETDDDDDNNDNDVVDRSFQYITFVRSSAPSPIEVTAASYYNLPPIGTRNDSDSETDQVPRLTSSQSGNSHRSQSPMPPVTPRNDSVSTIARIAAARAASRATAEHATNA